MSDFLAHSPDAGPLAYSIDFSDWLADGETLSGAAWDISPSGPTLNGQNEAGAISSINVAGGTAGVVYRLRCKPTTNTGQIDARSLMLRCDLL